MNETHYPTDCGSNTSPPSPARASFIKSRLCLSSCGAGTGSMSAFSETEEPRSLQPRGACSLGLPCCSSPAPGPLPDRTGREPLQSGSGEQGRIQCPSSGHLPDPGIKPASPALQAGSLPAEPPGSQLTGPAGGIKEIPCLLSHSPTLSPPCYLKKNHKKTKIEGSSLLAKWGLPVYLKTAKLGWRWQQTSRRDGVLKLSTFNLIAPRLNFSQPR